jgi:hypothetical protein
MDGLASAFDGLVGPASSEGLLREAITIAGQAVARQTVTNRLEIRRPGTDDELRALVLELWGVRIPDVQVCPNHTTPWRAFADAFFARSPVMVWKASRGFGGKTFLLAVLGLTEAVLLKSDVAVLGGSGQQSARVHEYMGRWWALNSAPRYLLANEPSAMQTRLAGGNVIRALMASSRSVRGPHEPRLRVDEIDELDLPILDAALGQPMATNGIPAQTVLSSTHQYADGTMAEVLKRAGERGWPVCTWCYRETLEPHGWLPAAEVERKRAEVPDAMFASEYDLEEPNPETRAIDGAKVAAMFRREVGHYRGGLGEYIELEPPVKAVYEGDVLVSPPGRYGNGGDWARKKDWTVIWTFRFDVRPARLVAYERMQRLPWPVMIARFDERVARYPGGAAHDGTGLGDVVDGTMKSSAEAFMMVGRPRSDLISEYVAAVERGEFLAPHIDSAEAAHRLASVDDLYGSGHLPDDIAAAALAYRAGAFGTLRGEAV